MGPSFQNDVSPNFPCPDWRFVSCFYVYILVLLFTNILGMHRSNEGCNSLLENTAAVLSDETLQMLFVSAQEANIALCITYATRK
jgi:hypothetical protein